MNRYNEVRLNARFSARFGDARVHAFLHDEHSLFALVRCEDWRAYKANLEQTEDPIDCLECLAR